MKVLIGAIGLGKYDGTQYRFEDGTTQEADYFLYALTRHVKPDQLIVVVTDKAKEKALPDLREWIELENVPLSIVEIPNGKDRHEAWTIFNALVAEYDRLFPANVQKPEVYVDVTNGLRSLPILMLSIVRYLQRARQIDLRAIFYGAYDAVEKTDNQKPVYQLDSFITVLDWATAVDTFLKTGSSFQLAEMIDTQLIPLDGSEEISQALRSLSEALDLVRMLDVHRHSHTLVEAIRRIHAASLTDENRIIAELLQRLQTEFEPLAMHDPSSNLREFLKKNLKLVLWYSNRNRYQDAMLLAREWMLTYKMQHRSVQRKRNGAYSPAEIFIRENRHAEEGHHQWQSREKKELHMEINNLRNAMAHGGLHDEQTSAHTLHRINHVIAELQKLETRL